MAPVGNQPNPFRDIRTFRGNACLEDKHEGEKRPLSIHVDHPIPIPLTTKGIPAGVFGSRFYGGVDQ